MKVRAIIRYTALLGLITVGTPSVAQAWSEAGHKIIASLALRQLTPEQQRRWAEILKQHPRYAEDFAPFMPAEVAAGDESAQREWLFQQAAIWPDMARGLPEAQKNIYNHPTWHYIDFPSFLTEADRAALAPGLSINNSLDAPATQEREMNAVQTIRLVRRDLRAASTDAERAVLLCWLLHVIGDVHQPLHSTAMFDVKLFPEGDKGGNSIPTQQGFNLHALWDEFLGDWSTFPIARQRADELLASAELLKLGQTSAADVDEKIWIEESRQLAQSAVYAPEVLAYLRIQAGRPDAQPTDRLPPLRLSEPYLTTGTTIATARVVQAGFRLGAVLKTM